MARKITFIAPVESMSGNLSGNQVLEYNGRKVWDNTSMDVPAGNYKMRYIAARKAANGLNYFNTRQRATASNSQSSRQAMALFGGSASVTSKIKLDAEHLPQLRSLWVNYKRVTGSKKSFNEFIFDQVHIALSEKEPTIQISDSSTGGVQYKNPWITGGTGSDVPVPQDIITKFAQYLGA